MYYYIYWLFYVEFSKQIPVEMFWESNRTILMQGTDITMQDTCPIDTGYMPIDTRAYALDRDVAKAPGVTLSV